MLIILNNTSLFLDAFPKARFVRVEMRGAMLSAIFARHNAAHVLSSEFLFVDGAECALALRGGAPLPEAAGALASEDARAAGAVVAGRPTVDGEPVDEDAWYRVVIAEYVLDTSLARLPEREGGFRDRTELDGDSGAPALVAEFLRRGGVLGA